MKRLSISLLSMLASMMAGTGLPAPAEAQTRLGNWVVTKNDTTQPAECLLVNLRPSNTNMLVLYRRRGHPEDLTILVTAPNEDVTELRADRGAQLRLDGQSFYDLQIGLAPFMDGLTLERFDASRGPVPIEPDLMKASRLEIQSPRLNASFDITGVAIGLEGLRQCDNAGMPQAAERSPNAGTLADGGSAAGSGSTGDVGGAGSEAERLGQAMKGMGSHAAVLAQFKCYVTGSQLYGMADINGRDSTEPLTINIAEDGVGELNGRALKPAYVEGAGSGSGSTTLMAVYPLKEVTAAMMGSPEHAAPPLLNMSPSELQTYRAALGYMQGIGDQMMAGRNRYMVVSLAENVVRFLDLTPQNQAVNVTTPQCGRTM